MAKKRETIDKYSGLTIKDYFFYSVGDFGICLVFGAANSLLQRYYSDCLLFNPIFILIIFLVARIWDAINDLLMGRIVDRVRPGKNGKFKRWILWMCVPLAIASVLMFALNRDSIDFIMQNIGDMWPAYVLAGFTYILFGMALTAVQIPYTSLANCVTLSSEERGKLSIWRGVMGHIGGIPCLAVKAFAFFPGSDPDHNPVEWQPLIIGVSILAVCTIGFLLLTYFGTKERYTSKQVEHKKGSMLKALGRIFKSRSMLSICVISAVVACGGMFMTGYSSYVVSDYFQMSGWRQTYPDYANICAIIITMVITPFLAKKFGKKETTIIGLLVNTACFVVMYFLRFCGTSETIYWIYVALNFIAGLGTSFFSMLMWGMVADAIDDMEIHNREREDGTSVAIMMFFRKVGQCLCFVSINFSLIAMGRYGSGIATGWHPSQDQLMLCWDLGALIPLACFGLGTLMFMFWFPISKKRLEVIQDEKEILLSEIEAEREAEKTKESK